MMSTIRGRVRKFGNNIDTDAITPAFSLHLPMEEMKKHAFGPVVPDFYKSVKEGDIIVGGSNFGCGSSREQATTVIKGLGIQFVVCDSMGRIYLRNCIGLGVYPILSKGVSSIFKEGDEIEIDMDRGELRNPKTKKTVSFQPLSGMPLEVFESGGILSVLKKKVEENRVRKSN